MSDTNASMVSLDDADNWRPEIERLAALSLVDYDRERKAAADKIGIRTATLDAEVERRRPTPTAKGNDRSITWPEVIPSNEIVNGADLLSEISALVRQFVVLTELQADGVALWIVMTWIHDSLECAPFLNVTSAIKRSGKSTLVDVLAALVFRALTSSGRISSAALFRIIERDGPTLLLDESDTFMRDDPELAGVINGSQRRSAAYVFRCEGDNNEPVRFCTWSPKAIVGIGSLPDTVTDRSIIIHLERKGAGEQISLWRHRDRAMFGTVVAQIVRWLEDNRGQIIAALPTVTFPHGLDDRQQDSWEPLLAIAGVAGGDWPERARLACMSLCASASDRESAKELLLADLYDLFKQRDDPDALETIDVLNYLNGLETRPWPEWSRGKPMTARALASQLKPFKIAPHTIRPDATRTAKGYKRNDFINVFSRYLPHVLSVTTSQPAETLDFSQNLSVTNGADVTDRNSPKPAVSNVCDVVTDRTPQIPGNEEITDDQRAILATLEDDAEERAALQDV